MGYERYLGFQIARTHKVLKQRLTALLKWHNLTVQQYRVLWLLYEEDGLSARDLVDRLFSDSSTIMEILDRLEEKELVRRRPDAQDRRVQRVFLTDAAKATLPQIRNRVDLFETAIQKHLSLEEIEALRKGLDKLYRLAAGETGNGPAAPGSAS
jgi:DNA-binding MarR family transcriptional regulator